MNDEWGNENWGKMVATVSTSTTVTGSDQTIFTIPEGSSVRILEPLPRFDTMEEADRWLEEHGG